jgi:ADP-ribosylglycohydrolase
MAIGDAFGYRFENQSRKTISLSGEEYTYQGQNRYTDDTQMALAVAELLISGRPFTGETLADTLLAAYHRDRRSGYSLMTRRMLEESGTGSDFLSRLPDTVILERKSDGAAMRALPIGFLSGSDQVIQLSAISARITHAHPDAVAATVGIALIAHLRYYHRDPFPKIMQELPDLIPFLTEDSRIYLQTIISSDYNQEIILSGHESYGVPYTESIILLGAVMGILSKYGENPHQCLINAVSLGGDTDTTASIALGAALINQKGYFPDALISGLEDGTFGRRYLIATGDALSARFQVRERNGS